MEVEDIFSKTFPENGVSSVAKLPPKKNPNMEPVNWYPEIIDFLAGLDLGKSNEGVPLQDSAYTNLFFNYGVASVEFVVTLLYIWYNIHRIRRGNKNAIPILNDDDKTLIALSLTYIGVQNNKLKESSFTRLAKFYIHDMVFTGTEKIREAMIPMTNYVSKINRNYVITINHLF